jgi:hypothetical protein
VAVDALRPYVAAAQSAGATVAVEHPDHDSLVCTQGQDLKADSAHHLIGVRGCEETLS